MDIKNKIIELGNGEKYIVADSIVYADRTFLLLGKVILETEDVEDIQIYELINNSIEKVLDEELVENLNKIFAMNIKKIN